MDSKELQAILDRLNGQDNDELMFVWPLQGNVDVAKGWTALKSADPTMPTFFGPTRFYLIKSVEDSYIGIVEDRGASDLHWYMQRAHRGQGYLSNALRHVILPHLFQDSRGTQCITVDYNSTGDDVHPLASAQLAMSVGFKQTSKQKNVEHYALDSSVFDAIEYFDGRLADFHEERAETLRKRITYYSKRLMMVCSELDTKLSDADELQEIFDDLKDIHRRLDSLILNAYEDRKIIIKNK